MVTAGQTYWSWRRMARRACACRTELTVSTKEAGGFPRSSPDRSSLLADADGSGCDDVVAVSPAGDTEHSLVRLHQQLLGPILRCFPRRSAAPGSHHPISTEMEGWIFLSSRPAATTTQIALSVANGTNRRKTSTKPRRPASLARRRRRRWHRRDRNAPPIGSSSWVARPLLPRAQQKNWGGKGARAGTRMAAPPRRRCRATSTATGGRISSFASGTFVAGGLPISPGDTAVERSVRGPFPLASSYDAVVVGDVDGDGLDDVLGWRANQPAIE